MKRANQPVNFSIATIALLSAASIASAHPGHGAEGFASGLSHPVNGLDHLLAMIGVGLMASGMRRAWVWALPLVFVGMMVLGAAGGAVGVFVPSWLAENGIAISVFAVGLMTAMGATVPAFVVAPLVGSFAVCHGSAHAAEMPAGASVAAYFGGFVLCTTGLHLAGIGLGTLAARSSPALARAGGMAMTLCGTLMIAGVL